MRVFKKALSVGLSLVMCASMVVPAMAAEYNINDGSVVVSSKDNNTYVKHGENDAVVDNDTIKIYGTGESTNNTIKVEDNTRAEITLDNVNIGGSVTVPSSALSVGAGSDVTVNLKGDNVLNGYGNKSAVELNNSSVTIKGNGKTEGSATLGAYTEGSSGTAIGGNGSVTIVDSIVTAEGSGTGAGIGGGNGSITIVNSNVTAKGATTGSGIDSGTGEIRITNSDVIAQGGWVKDGGAGIKSSGDKDITINGGTVHSDGGKNGIAANGTGKIIIENGATVGAYTTVEGDAIKGSSGGIVINGSDVTANSIKGGVAIGGNGCGDIEIKNDSTVNATSKEVAIGGNGYSPFDGNITIDDSTVTAVSKGETAIGGGGPGMSGKITIANGAVVTAISGGGANSAIGRDPGAIAGANKISVEGDSTLLALNKSTTPAVLRNEGEDHILNGQFDAEYFKNYVEKGNTRFTIVDDEDNELGTFDVKAMVEIPKDNPWDGTETYEGTFQSFGITWPEGAYAIKDAGGNYVCYAKTNEDDTTDKMVEFEASQLTNQGGLKPMENDVTYSYTEGDVPTGYEAAADAYKKTDGETKTVKANGGTWTLTWNRQAPKGQEVTDGMLADIEIVGTWEFKPDPKPPVTPTNPTPTPGGGRVPGDTPSDDPAPDAGETIEDEAVPLAGLPFEFGATDELTRGDVMGIIHWYEGQPDAELSDFVDVPEAHQWAVAIGWAQDQGIAFGNEDNEFRPDDLVLRGELEEFLNLYAIYLGVQEVDAEEVFLPLDGSPTDTVMWLEAEEIFDAFFALVLEIEAQAA